MAVCKNQKFVGRSVALLLAIGCGDAVPADSEFQRLGAMRTKTMSLEWETADATADDSIGALRENLATFQNLTISGDGTVKAAGLGAPFMIELFKHFATPDATGGQPLVWARLVYPDVTITAFCILSSFGREAPFDDIVTYSIEMMSTASDFGLIIEDTPNPDAVAATSVIAAPDTLALAVGQSYNAEAVVLPSTANQAARWSSATPSVATVSAVTGVITGVSAGTSVVTATSAVTPGVSDTIAVTVT